MKNIFFINDFSGSLLILAISLIPVNKAIIRV